MKKGVILEIKDQYTYALLKNGKIKRIKREYFHDIGQEITVPFLSSSKLLSVALVTCMIIIAVMTFPFQNIVTPVKALSYVSISVNPGIVLKVDEHNKITAVSYSNNDGQQMMKDINFVDKSLEDSVILFIDYCFENNYFHNNNEMSINVISDDPQKIKDIEQQIQTLIQDYLKTHQTTITMKLDQVSSSQQQTAQTLGISNSKMKLIDLVMSYYPHFNQEDLAKESVDDLIDYLEDANLDEDILDKLEDQVEDDDDDDEDEHDDKDEDDDEDDHDDD